MNKLKKYYWIVGLVVFGFVAGWGGTRLVADWQHQKSLKELIYQSKDGLREPMQVEEEAPVQNYLLQEPAIHVAHGIDLDELHEVFGDIVSVVGSQNTFLTFYRITPVQYDYKLVETYDKSVEEAITSKKVQRILDEGYVVADVTRKDRFLSQDKILVVLKRRTDRQPQPEEGQQISIHRIDTYKEDSAEDFEPFRDGTHKIVGMIGWTPGLTVLSVVGHDHPPRQVEFRMIVRETAGGPNASYSQYLVQREAARGWRFIKADMSGTSYNAVLVFSRPTDGGQSR